MKGLYKYREGLSKRILNELHTVPKINEWSQDVAYRLIEFINGGKLIRGCLVLAACEKNGGTLNDDVWNIAVALEFVQSGLLILDDIMDNDNYRRGKKSIHAQYTDLLNSDHEGKNMGMCTGTIVFFWAYQILSKISDHELLKKVTRIFSDEFMYVGYGQMQDVALTTSLQPDSINSILDLYTYKTARYTFSLPLHLGLLSAGCKQEVITKVDTIAQDIGVLFQIRDDELGLFGEEQELGKPIGSDIAQAKKTIYWYKYNKSHLPDKRVLNLFGQSTITSDDVRTVQAAMVQSGVKAEIQSYSESIYQNVDAGIASLASDVEFKQLLSSMVDYLRNRRK